ncbi:hypothetical protein B4N89_45535 [Embleya scabrispora]|uniref:Protein-L-isoaspartate O-methyltransferase n=1 Tax=Embleya scabrispora TaxID=159449 RepID=A0A1T3NIT5_9ACTN|nr:methyltransferase domain-containing protein [Embleya scabrispora]OPC76749.1 hypothetical protein B4N89_45535 [Embleya scabrispora]
MNTTNPPPSASDSWQAHAGKLAATLAAARRDPNPDVIDLFTRVPRHLFLPGVWRDGRHTPVDHDHPYSADLHTLAYTNTSHMTHQATASDPAGRTSSCSQPAVMADFLHVIAERANHRPVRRVLEIGAGTGFHAALIATLTGATVHTLDAAPVIVAEANAALARADLTDHVTAHLGDGHAGLPAHGPYDLIVATCGVIGVSPHWLDQLAPHGTILIPLAHGGAHPLAQIEPTTQGPLTGRLRSFADFMTATGPLYGDHPGTARTRRLRLPAPTHTIALDTGDPTWSEICDLNTYLAGHDTRTTCLHVENTQPRYGDIGLYDEPTHSAALLQDGAAMGTGPNAPQIATAVADLHHAWNHDRRPALDTWRFDLRPHTAADGSVMHVPHTWTRDRSVLD